MDEDTLITGLAAGLDIPTAMMLAEDEQPQGQPADVQPGRHVWLFVIAAVGVLIAARFLL